MLRHHYGLRTHIESGSCKAFNPSRPIGTHAPFTWPVPCALVEAHEIDQILARADFMMALKASCVLRGRQRRRPGSIFQHPLQDHRHLLDLSKDLDDRYQNEAVASGQTLQIRLCSDPQGAPALCTHNLQSCAMPCFPLTMLWMILPVHRYTAMRTPQLTSSRRALPGVRNSAPDVPCVICPVQLPTWKSVY